MKAREKGKPRGKAGASGGHWVTIHEPDGGYHHVFMPGPRKAGKGGKPNRAREADKAHRADFVSGGQVTGRQRDVARASKEATRLRTAREAHNEGVKARRMGSAVAGKVKAGQGKFREAAAAHKAKAAPTEQATRRAARRAALIGQTGSLREAVAVRRQVLSLSRDRRAARDLSPKDFADKVLAAAAANESGRFGRKAFISHVYEDLKGQPGFRGMSLGQFKSKLTEANRERHLDLGRADLVEAMDPRDVAASEARHHGAEFHFIKVDSGPAKDTLRAAVAAHKTQTRRP